MSSAGYGEYHVAQGDYSFDLAKAQTDRYRIEARGANKVDYYFFFGPGPKEILEQHLLLHEPASVLKNS
jgi:alpha-glucosidase (family GH31 glycosyl hydrolase)